MSIRVERKGDRIKVETDYPGSDVAHSMVYDDAQLLGGMKSFGIEKVEAPDLHRLQREFDRQFKEKTGRDQGYLLPY